MCGENLNYSHGDVAVSVHDKVGVTPEGVEVPRSLVDKEMQEKIKNMPEEFQPATPKGPDPKWRYMWRVGPRPANTQFKVAISM
jgi:hypothetical protein